jgi:hypothetical protein
MIKNGFTFKSKVSNVVVSKQVMSTSPGLTVLSA